MNEPALMWSTRREITSVVLAPQHLKRTACVAVIVGSAFVALNQLGVILAGHATGLVWFKVALTYLTPLIVSNCGILSATHRPGGRTTVSTTNRTGVATWTTPR